MTPVNLCHNFFFHVFCTNSSIFFICYLLSSSRDVPRIKLPEELFVNIGVAVGAQVNKFLDLIQDISCGGNLKQFLIVCFLTLSLSLSKILSEAANVLFLSLINTCDTTLSTMLM